MNPFSPEIVEPGQKIFVGLFAIALFVVVVGLLLIMADQTDRHRRVSYFTGAVLIGIGLAAAITYWVREQPQIFAASLVLTLAGVAFIAAPKFGGREAPVASFFLFPALTLVTIGLVYPAGLTIWQSFRDRRSKNFIGLENYHALFTNPDTLVVIRNTFIWVLVAPLLATLIGLVYAVLVDRLPGEAFAKSLIFLPMAISMVGATIIWKFVYAYKGPEYEQIGLLNRMMVGLGRDPVQWLDTPLLNVFAEIVILIWIQAGFAMTVLSASIKAIPDDINEAASLDGVGALQRFRYITVPSIRPALIVVLTTIAIATLKAFDIVYATGGGINQDSVLANEFYQSFNSNYGKAASYAVIIFILISPLVIYNVRQWRKAEAR